MLYTHKERILRLKEYYKRMKGVEPSSPAWKAGVIAVIRHPQKYGATILKNTECVNHVFRAVLYEPLTMCIFVHPLRITYRTGT